MPALYVHVPFCEKKCFYCSFVVAIGKQHQVDTYLDCLELEAQKYTGTMVETVYLGGGTPTFLSIAQLQRLFVILRENFKYSSQAEFTAEANPEDLDPTKAKILYDLGVNRISLGAQTFKDNYLKYLGRCHDAKRALTAYEILRKTGFNNINVDLMYAFPDQTAEELAEDVKTVTGLRSEHLSLYTLTVDENSRFYAQKIQQKNKHEQGGQYEQVVALLEKFGFTQYEISNFAKPGHESRHNTNYWLGGNYIGLGVGAHSHHDGERFWNTSRFADYLTNLREGKSPQEGSERLNVEQRLVESLLLGLRRNEGVDLQDMEDRFGCALAPDKKQKIKAFIQEGFLWQGGRRLGADFKRK